MRASGFLIHAAMVTWVLAAIQSAATQDGTLRAGTRTEVFIEATQVPVHVRLGGMTMAFAGRGTWDKGC